MSIERFDRVAALTLAHYKVTGPLHVVCKCDACAKTPNATVAHYSLQLALAERDKARADVAELRAALQGLFEQCAMVHKHWGADDNTKAANAAQNAARAMLAKLQSEDQP